MTLYDFDICSKIDYDLKNKIKTFHVFDDQKGYNILLITSEDEVYGLGQNTFGCCGLGHNNIVNTPQIIPELCNQFIEQFFIGYSFILALNTNGKIFGWGDNSVGQLGRGYESEANECLKPKEIDFFKDDIISQISCGSNHSLVLNQKNKFFVFGHNGNGECGVGSDEQCISTPIELKFLIDSNIKSMCCGYLRSFVLTIEGFVYSWGCNDWYTLGHQLEKDEIIFEPKLLNISDIKCISISSTNTYFLKNNGFILFCGYYEKDGKENYHMLPELLNNKLKFENLFYARHHFKKNSISAAINGEYVYFIDQKEIKITKYNSLSNFYANEYKLSYKTIDINNEKKFLKSFICEINDKNNNLVNLRKICKTNDIFKNTITYFNIFNDISGSNLLLITTSDNIISYGSNHFGSCGFGHNQSVDVPQIIPELYDKNIKEFSIGYNFILAQIYDNNIYGWGCNDCGQLGRGFLSKPNEYFRPSIIDSLKDLNISQISCGSQHSLVLTIRENVYGWGNNLYGQVGCEGMLFNSKYVLKPKKIMGKIDKIFCFARNSFAINKRNQIYGWGQNIDNCLGLDIEEDILVYNPKLIENLNDIKDVCQSKNKTYFLTNNGLIYMSGENKVMVSINSPKIIKFSNKFESIFSVINYKESEIIGVAISDNCVYSLNGEELLKTQYGNIFDYYTNEHEITPKTIEMNESIWFEIDEENGSDNNVNFDINYSIIDDLEFNNKFVLLSKLGAGGFGSVYKCKHKFDQQIYAIKVISFETKGFENIDKIMNEVKYLAKNTSSDFVVKFYNFWINANQCLYIQMEFCCDSLENILQQKPKFFGTNDVIEYYISCQLFKEIVECVQYIHGLQPPVIHRDLKPANILIAEKPINNRYLKLCDFGLAHEMKAQTTYLTPMGTRRYMAPELCLARSKFSIKSDIYSLGIIASDVFGYKMDSSDKTDVKTEYIMKNWMYLKELINQMIDTKYSLRPTCDQILASFEEWGLNHNDIKHLDYNQLISDNPNMFFSTYIKLKASI